MGIPPTGEEVSYEGIYIHRISGGKIIEEWDIADAFPELEKLAQEIRKRERT
jgi:predicted ester cyclase